MKEVIKPVKIKRKVKHKVKPVEAPRDYGLEIYERINFLCTKNADLYLAFINEDFAAVIKKKVKTVTSVTNPNSMQPHEKNEQCTFFDTFILEWGDKLSKHAVFDKLIDMKVPVHKVMTADGVEFVMREA